MMGDSLTQFTTCLKHNLPKDVFIKPDKSQPNYQKQVCHQCAFEFHEIVPAQLIKDSNKSLIERFESQVKTNSIQMNQVIKQLTSIRQLINKQIENLINEIRNQIQIQDNLLKQCKTNILQKEVIEQLHQQYLESQKYFQQASVQQIEIIKQNYAYDQMIKLIQEMDLNALTYGKKLSIVEIKQPTSQINYQILENKQKINKYEYEFFSKSTMKYDYKCCAIAFNRDASIFFAGCDKNIKVFEFKSEQFKEIQELQGHTKTITCLSFMKMSNQFISGSSDKQIKIWQQNYYLWINTDTLIGHYDQINCLLINQNEDLIISGGKDQIIFWRLQNKKWIDYEIDHSSQVYSLSLNYSNTKLISASPFSNLVEVFELQISIWCKVQEINLTEYRFQLCFISDTEFVILPYRAKWIQFYNFNEQNKEYEKINEINLKYKQRLTPLKSIQLDLYSGFPIQFIKSKNLLIIKNEGYVHILRKQEDRTFILDQSIEFQTERLIGSVSYDGQYLLILDNESSELQVRELKMIIK